MKLTRLHIFLIGVVVLIVGGAGTAAFVYTRVGFRNRDGFAFTRVGGGREGFRSARTCNECGEPAPCGCGASAASATAASANCSSGTGANKRPSCPPVAPCPRVMEPDLSKYILKSQIPSTVAAGSSMPDMTSYMLKTECPPVPDLSKYVLKSSIPKPQPVIIDNSACKRGDQGECPPCPRARCPEIKCPTPVKCPPPAPCPRPVCPPTVVKCKSEEASQPIVRPFLAPLNMGNFGMA
jgi:hypothetical protein